MTKAAMIFPGRLRPECEAELDDIAFYPASLDEAIKRAETLKASGLQVIISRGGTASEIKRAVSIPVVVCEVSNMDLLETLLDLKNEYHDTLKKVALILYHNVTYNTKKLEKYLNLKLEIFYWSNPDQLEDCVIRAKQSGADAALGAQLTVGLCRKYGLNGYLMQVGYETVRQAVQKAKEIIEIRNKDFVHAERLGSVINFAHEGIVLVNNDCKIEILNLYAAKLLNKNIADLVGKNVFDIFHGLSRNSLDNLTINKILQVNNTHVVFSIVPISINDRRNGTVLTFIESSEIVKAEHRIRSLLHTKGLVAKYTFSDFIGNSKPIKNIIKKAKVFAETDSTVLIYGENGTGKEIIAHSIHANSIRSNEPFVAVNCAALPENLLESEMFGYEEGAFTGARKGGKPGIFELAHRGTIFMDEISEMPMHLQVRLLRVIQERELMRIGGDKIIPVDVRIITTTNQNLKLAVSNNTFRSDLFHRLNLLNLQIPPLRHRIEDIEQLAKHFIKKYEYQYNFGVAIFTNRQIDRLKEHSWPGNVRELENFIHKYAILANKINDRSLFNTLLKEHLSETLDHRTANSLTLKIGPLDEMTTSIVRSVYESTGKNKTLTSKLLGINRNTVINRLRRSSIKRG